MGLLLVVALYVQNFNLKSQIGQDNFDDLNFMRYKLGVLIQTLEEEELNSYIVSKSVDEVQSLGYIANIGLHYSTTVFEGKRDIDRIENDPEYRERVTVRLKAYHTALEEMLTNADEYKENHFFGKIEHALTNTGLENLFYTRFKYHGKLYYNYISQEPRLKEILDEKFDEELNR